MQIPAITSTYPISQQRKLITSPFAGGFDFSSYLDQSSPIASATSKFRETVMEKVAIEMEKLWDDPESTTAESSQGSSRNPLEAGDSITINTMVERAITTTAQEESDGKIDILSSDGDGVSSIRYDGIVYNRGSMTDGQFVFRSTDSQSTIKYADGKYMVGDTEIPVATSTSSVQGSNIDNYKVQDTTYDSNGLKTITIGGVTYKRVDDENGAENIFVGPDGTRYLYKNNSLVELSNEENLTNEQTATGARVLVDNDAFVITSGYIGAQYLNMKNATTGQALETAEKAGDAYKSGTSIPVYVIAGSLYSFENGAFKKHNSNLEVGGTLDIKEDKADGKTTYQLGRTIESLEGDKIVVRTADGEKETYTKLTEDERSSLNLRDDVNFYKRGDSYYVLEGASLSKVSNISDPKYKYIYQETTNSALNGEGFKLVSDMGTIYIKGDELFNEAGENVTNNPAYYEHLVISAFDKEENADIMATENNKLATLLGVEAAADLADEEKRGEAWSNARITSSKTGYEGLSFTTTYQDSNYYLLTDGIYQFENGKLSRKYDKNDSSLYVTSDAFGVPKSTQTGDITVAALKKGTTGKLFSLSGTLLTVASDKQEIKYTNFTESVVRVNEFMHYDYYKIKVAERFYKRLMPVNDTSISSNTVLKEWSDQNIFNTQYGTDIDSDMFGVNTDNHEANAKENGGKMYYWPSKDSNNS